MSYRDTAYLKRENKLSFHKIKKKIIPILNKNFKNVYFSI